MTVPPKHGRPGAGDAIVCVMPRTSREWAGAAAMWITAAGWCAAGERLLGAGWVLTPDRIATAEETLGFTATEQVGTVDGGRAARGPGGRRRLRVPEEVKTGAKDLRRWRAARRYRRAWHDRSGPWDDRDVRFVWQHHDLFHRTGEALAGRLSCPVVSYVHAPQVWEAERWGTRRPGWGHLFERVGERPQLEASDLVACVSDEVAAELGRFGVPDQRIVVAPMAVDADRVRPGIAGDLRQRLRLGEGPLIGWTGSFRRFHGLEIAIDAFAEVARSCPAARLVLVGDGSERAALEARVAERGLGDSVVFTGRIGHLDIAPYLAAMDISVVTARAGEQFHYSPLKLREYLAAGSAVVAPSIGEVARVVDDGHTGLLYQAGDVRGLAATIVALCRDGDRRRQLGTAGRKWLVQHGTWEVQVERVLAALDDHGPRPGGGGRTGPGA
jgi:glycosyltransferase involved in cell wall biosynthesis